MKKLFQKKLNKEGFTLAELLIVVAIIGVLVAVAMPIFFGAKADAELAVKKANCRAVLAEATADYLADGDLDTTSYIYDNETYTAQIVSTSVIGVTGAGLKCDTNAPEPISSTT